MSSPNVLLVIVATPMLALAQTEAVDPGATSPAWSPYLVGVLIGVLSMFTFYFSDKPLGASTAFANVAGLIGRLIAPRSDALRSYGNEQAKPEVRTVVCRVDRPLGTRARLAARCAFPANLRMVAAVRTRRHRGRPYGRSNSGDHACAAEHGVSSRVLTNVAKTCSVI